MKSDVSLLSLRWVLSALLLLTAVLLGGGQGFLGDTAAQLLALALLAVLWRKPGPWPKAALWAIPVLLLPALFLLPWPSFFTDSAARAELQRLLLPVIGPLPTSASLSPAATERALLWLLPAIALYCAGLRSSVGEKQALIALLLAGLLLSVLVGWAQKNSAGQSLLYFYQNTNRHAAVGFFANNNHYAVALAVGLVLVLAWLGLLFRRRMQQSVHPLQFIFLSLLAVLFLIGFMLSGSRAGLALGMLGAVLVVPAIIAADAHSGAKRWLFALLALGLLLTAQLGMLFILQQFEADPLADGRWQFAQVIGQALNAFHPAGPGPGSFWFVYPQYAGSTMDDTIVNHAHNDYLELWLESRWVFVLAAAPVLLAYAAQGIRLWLRSRGQSPEALLMARAAWLALLLLLLHSLVDYPLRTTALSAVAGLLAACCVLPANVRTERPPKP